MNGWARRGGAALRCAAALLWWAFQAFAQAGPPQAPAAAPHDREASRAAASAIAASASSVTEMRTSVARAFGARPARNPNLKEALVDFDPRYRENLVAGLKTGIVSPNAPGAYQPYVWGGRRTSDYPYVVAVVGSREVCTGVVLNGNAVLTAAHCFCNNRVRQIHTGAAVFRGTAVDVVGAPRSLDALDCERASFGRDVGLLYLPSSAKLPSARLATQQDLAKLLDRRSSVLRLVGYGLTQDGGLGAKNFVDLPVASPHCAGSVPLGAGSVSDGDYYGCLPSRELVAGAVALNEDACGGDSGAPLILEDGAGATIMAVSSRSVARRRACGDGGIYALCDAQVLAFLREAQAARPE